MPAPPIALVVNAVDRTANAFDRINARIEQFSKQTQSRIDKASAPFRRLGASIAKFSEVSGLNRVGSAIGNIARRGQEAFQRVGELVPLIGVIGSAASVAGITRMVTAWSEWGQKISLASQRMDMSASHLASMDAAAQMAGSSAGALTAGLQALGQTMYDAVGGRNTAAIVMFNTLGVAFRKNATEARSAEEVYPEVADKIAGMTNRYAQAQAAAALFGGAAEDLLPFLRRGAAGYREYNAIAARYLYFTDQSAAAADRLRESQVRVGLAVEGLRNRIAERLEPILTPMLTHFADWLANSPAVAHAVDWLGQKVDQLATYLDTTNWDAFGTTVEGWGENIKDVTAFLGGPKAAIEDLMLLMVGSFALKVIMPFLQLGTAVVAATAKIGMLIKAQKEVGAAPGGIPAASPAAGGGLLRGLAGAAGIGLLLDLLSGHEEEVADANINRPGSLLGPAAPPQADTRAWYERFYKPGPGLVGGGGPRAGAPAGGAQKSTFDTSLSPQARGLLDTIAGTESAGRYDVMYGGGTLADYSNKDAPEHTITSGPNKGRMSSAFGRYQFINGTWREAASALGLQDKTPASQDRAAWWLAQRDYAKRTGRQLSDDINSTDPAIRAQIGTALHSTWTSLPGGIEAGTNQNRFLEQLSANTNREMAVPGAAGAPMQMAANDARHDNDGNSTVRVEFGGQLPDGMKMRLDNPQKVDVGGPLVERPMLLGANA